MARKIDFTKPLDEDELAYVAGRPWLLQDARLNGQDIITDEDFFVDDEVEGSDEGSDDSDDGSEDKTDEGDDDGSEGDADDESDEEDGEGDEDEVAPYAEWEYPALQEEAKSRELSAKGSKEQLVKRLEEDDASTPE